jgi:hypothetical protein
MMMRLGNLDLNHNLPEYTRRLFLSGPVVQPGLETPGENVRLTRGNPFEAAWSGVRISPGPPTKLDSIF